MSFSSEQAEITALNALNWLSGQDQLVHSFLAATGTSADDIRQRAHDPEFLASVMDFIMMDDNWVIDFCDANQIGYDTIHQVRAALPGGDIPNWT